MNVAIEKVGYHLAHPKGEDGIKVAEMMAHSNYGMIEKSFQQLSGKDKAVLEIGFGNSSHLESLLSEHPDTVYVGVEQSETMIRFARELWKNTPRYKFIHSEDFVANQWREAFDAVISVNTLYFQENPKSFVEKFYPVLKDGGCFILTFADKEFMTKVPFVNELFTLYSLNDVKIIFEETIFAKTEYHTFNEILTSPDGEQFGRDFHVVCFYK